MRRLIRGEKAQAAVELAILASVMILAFSALITLTEKVNRRQDHIQKVFRAQLAAAYQTGQASSTAASTYYRAPNIIDPYAPGELVFLTSSGHVLWKGGSSGTNTDVSWTDNKQLENISYTKQIIRKEAPGGLLDARHKVSYYDPIKGKVVTRGEYE